MNTEYNIDNHIYDNIYDNGNEYCNQTDCAALYLLFPVVYRVLFLHDNPHIHL